MFAPFFVALAAAGIFYVLVPAVGAFVVRASWRRFRALLLRSVRLVPVGYGGQVREASGAPRLDRRRCFGGIEAIEGSDRLWVRVAAGGTSVSVVVEMANALLYSLPAADRQEGEGAPFETSGFDESDDSPEPLSWRGLPALPEGASTYVCGPYRDEAGRRVFSGTRADPVLVLLYTGPKDELLRRCVRQGRQPNEYWNRLTPISFSAGAVCMVAILLSFPGAAFIPEIFLMTALAAIIPLLPLLPPGLILFFIYRSAWKKARSLRATRDSVMIPCAALQEGATASALPGGQGYERRQVQRIDPASLPRGMRVRGWDEMVSFSGSPGYTCFGSPDPSGALARPSDPLAEFVVIPGVPEELSRRCALHARGYTALAGAALAGAVFLNSVLAFLILRAAL